MKMKLAVLAALVALSGQVSAQVVDSNAISGSGGGVLGGSFSAPVQGVTGGVTTATANAFNATTAGASATSPTIAPDTANTSVTSVGGDLTGSASLGLAGSGAVAGQFGAGTATAQSNPAQGDQARAFSAAGVGSGSYSASALFGVSAHTNLVGVSTSSSSTADNNLFSPDVATTNINNSAFSSSLGGNAGFATGAGAAAFGGYSNGVGVTH